MQLRRTLALSSAVATASLVLAGLHAPANAADTVTTFTITAAGGLGISAPVNAALGSVASGAATVSGSLGAVSVTDERGLILGNWTATASSTDFVHGTDTAYNVAKAQAVYATGAVSGSGGGLGVGVGGSLAAPVVAATRLGAGNNTGSWNPTVTVALSPTAVVGTYTATITHSVS